MVLLVAILIVEELEEDLGIMNCPQVGMEQNVFLLVVQQHKLVVIIHLLIILAHQDLVYANKPELDGINLEYTHNIIYFIIILCVQQTQLCKNNYFQL